MELSQNINIGFYLTNDCNFRCEHCEHNGGDDKSFMSIEQIDDSILWLQNVINRSPSLIPHISITGGEPLLSEHFYYFLEKLYKILYSGETKYYIYLYTNGSIELDESKTQFSNFIYETVICNSQFHDVFRNFNNINFKNYLFYSQRIRIENLYTVRNLGRAKDYIRDNPGLVSFYRDTCINKEMAPFVIFAPNHIRFCPENSIDFSNPDIFTTYDKIFDNDYLYLLQCSHMLHHSQVTLDSCPVKCKYFLYSRRK